jgi:DNA-directed RNA polymerase II subunit RPB1
MRSSIAKPKIKTSVRSVPVSSLGKTTESKRSDDSDELELGSESKSRSKTSVEIAESTDVSILAKRKAAKLVNNNTNVISLSARSQFPTTLVSRVRMGLYSADEIRKLSVAEVVNDIADGQGSVNDPTMGPRDSEKICPTCHSSIMYCEGHPGHIEFPIPIFNPAFIKYLSDIFGSICIECAYPLLKKEELKEVVSKNPDITKRLRVIRDSSAGIKECTRPYNPSSRLRPCSSGSRIYTRTQDSHEKNQIVYRLNPKDDVDQQLSAIEAYKILNAMVDPEVLDYFGFSLDNHPRNMIMFNMIVTPPNVRLMNVVNEQVVEHDMTKFYRDLIKSVNNIKELQRVKSDSKETQVRSRGRTTQFVEDTKILIEKELQKISTIIQVFYGETTSFPGQQKKKSMELKSFFQTKEGIFRQLLMSHRIDHVARSIIAADPSLKFGQIGIPYAIAETQTVEKRVTKHNHSELTKLYDLGRVKFITKFKGPYAHIKKSITKKNMKDFLLEEGDLIERVLQDGDWVIYNRQPSIHRESLRAMMVKVGPYKQIRIHMSDTKLSNAD